MKKIIIGLFLFAFSFSANAGENYVQGNFGFDAGSFNFGLDYEMRKSQNYGYGAYFMFSSEEEGASPQLISIGALAKIHLLDNQKMDIALSPGFGVTMIEFGPGDETVIGPVLKVSALYKVNEKMAFGVEMFKAYNWLSDEVPFTADYLNLAFRLRL